MKHAWIILLAVPLIGCGTMFQNDAVSLKVENADGGSFQQGHVHTVTFTVTNVSKWPILVTSLVPETNEHETTFEFQRKYYGSTDSTRDSQVSYNPRAQQSTDAIFNEGLLMPGQSLKLLKSHRVLDATEDFLITYTIVDTPRGLGDLARRVFVGGASSGATPGVYTRPSDEQLNQFKSATFPPVTGGINPSPRAVVFPEGRYGKTAGRAGLLFRDDRLKVTFAPTLLPMSREEAGKKAGVSTYLVHTYSEALSAWIANRGAVHLMVTQDGRTHEIPRVPALLFKSIDASGEALVSVEEPAAFTAMGFKTSEGDPPYASGLKFILVTRENLQSFLNHEHLKGTRATVEAVQYFFKKHYFKIVKP